MKFSKAWQEALNECKKAAERLMRRGFVLSVDNEFVLRRLFRDYVAAVARLWRERGFPDYALNYAEKQEELRSLLEYDRSGLIVDGVVGPSNHGLRLANSYFPHMGSVRGGNRRAPIDVFKNDALREKSIFKRVKHGSFAPQGKNKYRLSISEIRKGLRTFTGTQGVSNFRPSAAAAIYEKLLPSEGGVTWDMSMGWGGRMLGALACKKVRKYIGCEPSTKTFEGLIRMQIELLPMARNMGRDLEVEFHMLGSETLEMRGALPGGGVDLAFTSPPYFDCEKYSDEETQSWKRFPNKEQWLTGFMGQTLDNCAYCLKEGGTLAINIAGVSGYTDLPQRFMEYAESKGWKLMETLRLALSSGMGNTKYRSCPDCIRLTEGEFKVRVTDAYDGSWKRCREHKYKYEPIFVFKRNGQGS